MAHEINNAYDAWWFLDGHPKFNLPERLPSDDGVLRSNDKDYYQIVRDLGGNYWMESKVLCRKALTENLGIFFTKVDSTGRVGDDKAQNTIVECWLEFGHMEYGYDQPEFEAEIDHARSYLLNFHDVDLDCGAATFDDALVILANNVLKNYGDYENEID